MNIGCENSIQILSIQPDHVARLEQLPLHHYDRILIAQSMHEDMPILSADPLLGKYAATLIW